MKLLFCPYCEDIIKLQSFMRHCKCKKTFGKYTDSRYAEVSADSVSIGIGNGSLKRALIALRGADNFSNVDREQAIVKGKIDKVWVRGNTAPSNPHTKIIARQKT